MKKWMILGAVSFFIMFYTAYRFESNTIDIYQTLATIIPCGVISVVSVNMIGKYYND